ncbi:Cytochrome c-552/DMSO reductase-like, heme-binding domain-containing protein [Alkalidesulfovibrio alkalitolerans DSM 16529]|jgi:hypothetical protein|uniref:Cytochrome c-552/DMSO reductase-like, heme-binding domain-containing protein n=1 Tax=Alkalidesulfovibrio alkalitolerans DSM 16529 TaxID=1121439 RepID=S7T1R3_9BACT|nr:ethylbenzene dehydrogenase-related protein [Alkalidesulfovibrio alkalitolerans]EPR31012.1 Cytochrome c-552/DMSO reductase-like, heme-binding domain-containing protein [Alkalidesulfovibrio alkalitolerans DSM 16529]
MRIAAHRLHAVRLILPVLCLLLAAGPAAAYPPDGPATPLAVQAAYDDATIALRFSWKTDKGYPGLLHDLRSYDAAKGSWERPARVNEDRISFMVEDIDDPVQGFANHGCWVTCHTDLNGMPGNAGRGDTRHYVLKGEGQGRMLDMWHWRGGRSGPMGYAEDTWVRAHDLNSDAQGRRRDDDAGSPTTLLRDKGDRLREDQPFAVAFTFESKDVTLPEFVFDPQKNSGHYFLVDDNGLAKAAPVAELANAHSIEAMARGERQHALIATGEKANALHVASLSDEEKARIAAEALAGGIIPRPVLFDHAGDQHDIRAERAFDEATMTWTVTMIRALDTGSKNDVSFKGLDAGRVYTLGMALHDGNGSGMSHLVALPASLGKAGSGSMIEAARVSDVAKADWTKVPTATVDLFTAEPVSWQEIDASATN